MKKHSGFTLIELMVVMAIIAILATVGLSAYTGYIAKARDTARAPLARTIELAVMSFMSSHNGVAPTGDELVTELTSMGVSWVLPPSVNPAVALVSETLDTLSTLNGLLGFTTYALPVKDPAGGKSACLDKNKNPTQPCRFDYIKYDDGSYSISYGVEHPSSMEKNFYYVDNISGGDISTKYGVFVGNAVFIGVPVVDTVDYVPDLPGALQMPTNVDEPVKLLNDVVAAPATTAGPTTTAAPTTTGVSGNIIPQMISNTAPSGIASASGVFNANYDSWYAFAYNLANGDPQTWVSVGNSGWLQYQFPVAHAVIRYQITNRDEPMTRAPANWTFAGSNNGTSWTTLDTQSNPNWASSRATVFTIDIPNTTAYSYYRLTVSNSDSYIGIGRLRMYEATGL